MWGSDNREAIVRATGPRIPGRGRFEMRFVDGTACPHVALAGILAAGVEAVRTGRVLEVGDCAKPVVQMSEEEMRAVGVCGPEGEVLVGRLPRSIEQARRNLAEDKELGALLGEVFVEKFLAVNEVSLPPCTQSHTDELCSVDFGEAS